MRKRMSLSEAEEYLNNIPRFSKKTTMENERRILALLGHPEAKQKFVHVAGTNGKGSVCAFLTSILMSRGKHTATFTSPHLVHITERFLIDGRPVSDEAFLDAFHRLYDLCEEAKDEIVHPSYFEFLFLIGMMLFAEAGVDITILEVGLGGRLDATNVIESPLVCVIASISLDHTEILGDTIAQIAAEKAGIMKAGSPVVYDASNPEAAAVMERTAGELGIPAYPVKPSDFVITDRAQTGITFEAKNGIFAGETFALPFVADYQAMNASLALQAAAVLEAAEGEEGKALVPTLKEALRRTSWPGRMEPVLPGVFMDGAHNDDGIRVFIETAVGIPCTGKKYLLFSAVVEKDYETMIEEICSGADFDGFILTELDSYRALPLEKIKKTFEAKTTKPIWSFGEISEALAFAREKKKEEDLLFIAGSLYLAGTVKALLAAEKEL